jgi:hypothetical protein
MYTHARALTAAGSKMKATRIRFRVLSDSGDDYERLGDDYERLGEVQVFDLSDNGRMVFDAANHNWQRILRCCIENLHNQIIAFC